MGDFSAAASLASRLDRSEIPNKIRLHAVAKMVGLQTKQAVELLAQQGIKKVAQSSVTGEEANALLDSIIAAGKPAEKPARKTTRKRATAKTEDVEPTNAAVEPAAEPAALDSPAEDKPAKRTRKRATRRSARSGGEQEKSTATLAEGQGDVTGGSAAEAPNAGVPNADAPNAGVPNAEDPAKLEERVRKNVDNEISQIERKVEEELDSQQPADEAHPDSPAEQDAGQPQDGQRDRGDNRHVDTGTVDVAQLHEALVEAGLDLEDPFAPVVTPKPDLDDDEDGFEYAPIFMPPKEPSKPKRRSTRKAKEESAAEPEEVEQIEEPRGIRGSTRIEAQRRRRQELREKGRERKHLVSQAEFLARRESVERTMVVREKERNDGGGKVTQVAVLEDNLLVEHFVTSETQASMIGNIYLGRVQNVLPSMEAAFIDIGQGRNGVVYAGEINWRQAGLGGRSRKIEQALKSGDQLLVQVAKDPVGHKGARLTTQISLAGRYLVYVPNGRSAGISRKLPVPERKRLKGILERVVPDDGGAIIRTAAENVPEQAIAKDVNRLHSMWEDILKRANKEKSSKGAKPVTLYEEPDLLVKVVRDLFNEDFHKLVVDGNRSFNTIDHYVQSVAPDLADRVERYDRRANGGQDAFESYQIDEQLQKALSRQVWLPSGGTLVIDRTEAMTVIDVNTGKFTGSGGNLEETVTRNNLEAAEEIVRQMRLRDLGGMIVVDFIDMVLPENQDLVLRRLKEALGRDRTRHQVSEVTSLGLVQMTRKRLGTGLVETFSTECEACNGRGILVHEYPVDEDEEFNSQQSRKGGKPRKRANDPARHPAIVALHQDGQDSQDDQDAQDGQDSQDDQLNQDSQHDQDSHDDSASRENRNGRGNRNSRGRKKLRRDARYREDASQDDATQNGANPDHANQSSSYEDLADAVIAPSTDSSAHGSGDADSQDGDEQSGRGRDRRAKRRRGTRGSSRGRAGRLGTQDGDHPDPGTNAQEDTSNIEAIAHAAADNAEATDEVGEFTSYIPDNQEQAQEAQEQSRRNRRRRATKKVSAKKDRHQVKDQSKDRGKEETGRRSQDSDAPQPAGLTYDEALAAFEASPRRKRKTRGNSRSDHKPRREDFAPSEQGQAGPEPEEKREKRTRVKPQQDKAPRAAKSERSSEQEVESAASARRRRRVVRKLTPERAEKDAPNKTSVAKAEPKAAKAAQADVEAGKASEQAEGTQQRSRRRARKRVAVRRTTGESTSPSAGTPAGSTAAGNAPDAQDRKPSEKQAKADNSKKKTVKGPHGRRRVVRRSTT
ncbi:hypothetical protein CPHO_03230 [Corynebacterium phocae]|uniref:Ribonuclease E n=1 Tax=Corynebacterium phocae TaxID=161895 RepID=A0A1L7D688_9CORY|nr:hypothetical protein CPHO_03230 [Corynebacterium phocae]